MAENAAAAESSAMRKEKKTLDPRIAFVIMLVMLCIALCIGANKAWRKNREGVDASFAVWQESMQLRTETAYNLLTVAKRYLPEESDLIRAVRTDLSGMENDASSAVNQRAAAGAAFVADAGALLKALAENTAVQQDSRDSMYVNLMLPQAVEQCSDESSLNAYNTAASGYNDAMRCFSGLLARLTGVNRAALISADAAAE